jgi:hypothetical protein
MVSVAHFYNPSYLGETGIGRIVVPGQFGQKVSKTPSPSIKLGVVVHAVVSALQEA